MTAQTFCLHRQCRRCLHHGFQAGLHVQTLGSGVVGNGRLKEVAIERVKVGQAKMAGSKKVFELSASDDLRIFRILSQHQLRAFERQVVFHAGGFVLKGSALQHLDCKAARVCHRCSKIVMQNLSVALAATGVCSAHGRRHVDRRLLCVPQNSTGQPDGKKRRSACQRHRAISVRPA
jgi:hypothetical protein